MTDPVDDTAQRIVKDAARSLVRDATSRTPPWKMALVATGVVMAGVFVLGLLARLWFYAMGLAVVAGVGGAAYLALKPRVDALTAGRRQRALAAKAEDDENREAQRKEDALRAAAAHKASEQQRLEEQLAELKRRKG